MARNTVHIDAPPEEVFAALLVPENYADWVFGTKEVRGTDDDWPAVGSRLHHTVGAGPLTVRDHTRIETIEPPERLVLIAKAGTLGDARVEIVLAADGDGTELTIDEVAVSGLGEAVPDALTEPAIAGRNGESLRRLKRLVEEGRR